MNLWYELIRLLRVLIVRSAGRNGAGTCFACPVGPRLEVLMMRKRIQMGRPEVGHIHDSAVVDSTRPDRGEGVLKI